jgi:hypothetical protein
MARFSGAGLLVTLPFGVFATYKLIGIQEGKQPK